MSHYINQIQKDHNKQNQQKNIVFQMITGNSIESRIIELQSELSKSKMQEKRYQLQLRGLITIRSKISQSVDELSSSYQRQVRQMEVKIKKLEEENRKLLKKNDLYKMSIQNFEKTILEKDKIISTILAKEFTPINVMKKGVQTGLIKKQYGMVKREQYGVMRKQFGTVRKQQDMRIQDKQISERKSNQFIPLKQSVNIQTTTSNNGNVLQHNQLLSSTPQQRVDEIQSIDKVIGDKKNQERLQQKNENVDQFNTLVVGITHEQQPIVVIDEQQQQANQQQVLICQQQPIINQDEHVQTPFTNKQHIFSQQPLLINYQQPITFNNQPQKQTTLQHLQQEEVQSSPNLNDMKVISQKQIQPQQVLSNSDINNNQQINYLKGFQIHNFEEYQQQQQSYQKQIFLNPFGQRQQSNTQLEQQSQQQQQKQYLLKQNLKQKQKKQPYQQDQKQQQQHTNIPSPEQHQEVQETPILHFKFKTKPPPPNKNKKTIPPPTVKKTIINKISIPKYQQLNTNQTHSIQQTLKVQQAQQTQQIKQVQQKQQEQQIQQIQQTEIIPKPIKKSLPPPPVKKSPPPSLLGTIKPKTVRQKHLPKYKPIVQFQSQLNNNQPQENINHYFQPQQISQNNNILPQQTQQSFNHQNYWKTTDQESFSPQFGHPINLMENQQNNIEPAKNQFDQVQQSEHVHDQLIPQHKQQSTLIQQNQVESTQNKAEIQNISHSSINRSKKSKRQPPMQFNKLISFDDNQQVKQKHFDMFASQRQQPTQKSQQFTIKSTRIPRTTSHKQEITEHNDEFNFKQQELQDHQMHGMVDESSIQQIDDLSMISGSIFPEQAQNFESQRFQFSEKKKRKASQHERQEQYREMMAPGQNKKMSKKKGKRDNVQTISFV